MTHIFFLLFVTIIMISLYAYTSTHILCFFYDFFIFPVVPSYHPFGISLFLMLPFFLLHYQIFLYFHRRYTPIKHFVGQCLFFGLWITLMLSSILFIASFMQTLWYFFCPQVFAKETLSYMTIGKMATIVIFTFFFVVPRLLSPIFSKKFE